MDSGSPSSPADATMSLVTDGKCRRTKKGKAFGSPTKKSGKVCWGRLKGNFSHRIIQHKAQHSTEAKARGATAGVKQQGYGDPRGGHVVSSSRQQVDMGYQHQKADRRKRAANDRPPDTNGDCRETHNLEVAPRQTSRAQPAI
jgi:hypothetical protein